ncbi:MAG: hypothetical protein RIR26_2819, partial [Pseudomonadota bacterium]
MNIFRTATGQAIRDIIVDHSQENRFGRSLTEQDIDSICERVVDLFETTLNLRAQLAGAGFVDNSSSSTRTAAPASARTARWEEEPASPPRTRAAAELYDFDGDEKQRRG